jgi:hypothetical protein
MDERRPLLLQVLNRLYGERAFSTRPADALAHEAHATVTQGKR